jgi:N-acetylglucosamine-6-sulfatase
MRLAILSLFLAACTPRPIEPTSQALVGRAALVHDWERPVIFLLLDDFEQDTFINALSGNILPNIKTQLVDKGVTFSNSFTVDATCCTNRSSTAAGQYPHNNGTFHNQSALSRWTTWEGANVSLFEHLDGRGYETGFFGKWLNGYTARANTKANGIDYWAGLYNEDSSYSQTSCTWRIIDHGARQTNVACADPDGAGRLENYQTDDMSIRARNFIRAQSVTSRWFLYLAPTVPHVSHTAGGAYTNRQTIRELRVPAPSRHTASIRASADSAVPTAGLGSWADLPCCVGGTRADCDETDISDKAAWMKSGPNNEGAWPALKDVCSSTSPGTSPNTNGATLRRLQLDRLEALRAADDLVGTIYTELTARGQQDTTVFIFAGDNGLSMGQHRRSMKLSAFEPDVRVPMVIRGGGFEQGVTRQQPVLNVDIAPTIAAFIGGASFAGADGRSLLPILRGQTPATWRKAALLTHWWADASGPPRTGPLETWELPDFRAIRTFSNHSCPNQKLIEYLATGAAPYAGRQNEPPWTQPTAVEQEHYDLNADPYEVAAVTADSGYSSCRSALATQVQAMSLESGADLRALEEE